MKSIYEIKKLEKTDGIYAVNRLGINICGLY